MIPYSFLLEEIDDYSDFNPDIVRTRRKIRKNFHTPQSKHNVQSGTIGSFSSITNSKYNNIYNNSEEDYTY